MLRKTVQDCNDTRVPVQGPWASSWVLSSPEPKARVSYCHSAPSVRRRSSSVNYSHFQLLLKNRLMDFDKTW